MFGPFVGSSTKVPAPVFTSSAPAPVMVEVTVVVPESTSMVGSPLSATAWSSVVTPVAFNVVPASSVSVPRPEMPRLASDEIDSVPLSTVVPPT